MKIDVPTFKGMAPRLTPRALPPNAAQDAVNCRLQSGDLESWRHFLLNKSLANTGPVQTIYLLNDKWLSWNDQVDVARSLIPGDASYLTFLTCPDIYTTPRFTTYAMAVTGAEPYPVVTRPLGVPSPANPPTLAVGTDTTPTSFTVNTVDNNAQLATAWTVNSPLTGTTYATVTQQSGYYEARYDENRSVGTDSYAYRNFGVEGVNLLTVTSTIEFAGDTSHTIAGLVVGADASGAGVGVIYADGILQIRNTTIWSHQFGVTPLASVTVSPALSGAVKYLMRVTATLNTGGTKTVTAKILNSTGATVLATVTATGTFVDGDNCGFVTGVSDDGTPQYVTKYSDFTVNATGSTNYVPVNIAVSYVYTFVNDLGWESAPSPASATVLRPDGVSTVLTMATTYPDDPLYAVTTKNLYRAVTGATGTIYTLVASGIPLATATYNDVLDDSKIGPEVLLSTDWDLPNKDMEGIIALPNGIMAGFFKNQLCLSAAGAPWAWPVAYRLPTDTDIVAIANIDNTIVIGTKSFVYTATGNAPESYSMSKPGEAQSCVSKRSMTYVDGFGVVFASPDGWQVCAGSAGNVRNATSSIFTKRQWQALVPTSILSAVHDGVLHWFYDTTPTPHVCTEGPTWTARTVPIGTWIGLAANSSRFVLTGGHSSALKAAYSTDGGVTWNTATTIPPTGSGTFGNVAYLAAAGLFVACGSAVSMLTSPDGDVWTERTVSTFGNGKVVAAGGYAWVFEGAAAGTIRRTADGINYTSCTMPASADWQDVAYDGVGRYVAVSNSRLAYSDDNGGTWTAGPTYTASGWRHIEYGNGVFAIVDDTGGGGRMTSTNGTAINSSGSTPIQFNTILFSQGVFMAAGSDTKYYTSLDGITYTLSANALPSIQQWGYLTTDGNGSYFVVRINSASATQGASGLCSGPAGPPVVKSGYALDTSPDGFGLIQLGYHATAAHVNPITDELYLVLDALSEPTDPSLPIVPSFTLPGGNAKTIYQFDAHASLNLTYRWKGKLNLLPHPSQFHFAKVEAGGFTNILARVYEDGVQRDERAITSASEYRKDGRNAPNSVELELLGTSTVRTFQVAQTVDELD